MTKKENDVKTFNMRLPKETWLFLKKTAAEQEESMANIIVRCVNKYKNKLENRLTPHDAHV